MISLASRAINIGIRACVISIANIGAAPTACGRLKYLNTAPLIWSFQRGRMQGAVELVTDAAPARCGDLLARGEVEAALVPIIEYQRIPGVQVVPGVCVGSHSAVRSVVLVSKYDDLKDVRRVGLDASSRTSQALVKIVFREFLNCEPQWETYSPDIRDMMKDNGSPTHRRSRWAYHYRMFMFSIGERVHDSTTAVFAMDGRGAVEWLGT